MATKRQIADELKREYGPLISQTQLRAILNGMSKTYVLKFMEGVDSYKIGKKKCYWANDVARRLEESKCL